MTDPELVRFVAVKSCHKFERTDFVAKIIPSISRGLFAAKGKVHSRQKRMIGPAFSSTNLSGFFTIFQENTDKLVQVISVRNNTVNIIRFLLHCTIKTINIINIIIQLISLYYQYFVIKYQLMHKVYKLK